jgi:hypothetical protein
MWLHMERWWLPTWLPMSRAVTVAQLPTSRWGYAASPRRDDKLALTDGVTVCDRGGCGERAEPIRSARGNAALTAND